MSTTPPVTPPVKQSWLSKVGHWFGKVLKIIATDAQPIEKIALPVAEALLPAFAPEIAMADALFTKIVNEAVAAESVMASAGTATGTGPQKLAQVLGNIGPVLDAWTAANFPGSKQISDASKAGLVNAVVAILNDISPAPPAA